MTFTSSTKPLWNSATRGASSRAARVERAVDDLFNMALELGGTLSGEHGIGTAKKKWLELETSKGTLGYMRRMRSAFDPKKLLNASKVVSL